MDKKSKVFFLVFFLLIVGSIAVTYYRTIVQRDYMIQAESDCDPYTEACFIYVCDPEAEECTGDPVEDTWYYKLIDRNAKNMPLCDPSDESCEVLTCPEGEADCTITFCDPTTADEGVECSDPATYTLENPIEEEGTEEEGIEEESGEEEVTDNIEGAAVATPESDALEGEKTVPNGAGVETTGKEESAAPEN